jgi:hypothetical protein
MTDSKLILIEEIIGVLWLIAALLAFGQSYVFWGYVFSVKAAMDMMCTIIFAVRHLKEKENAVEGIL